MFDHVTIRVSDRGASERFYNAVLRTLGLPETAPTDAYPEWDDFGIAEATDGQPVTRRLHVAFGARDRAQVDAFWQAGVDAGHRDAGRPGPRPQYKDDYYGAFLLDPDGTSVEAVHHGEAREGRIDHVWMRVADVAAARDFYATVAPHARLRLAHDGPERATFAGAGGSLSLVPGDEPTVGAHLAFPAPDHATVEAFHAAALAAGHRDNGAPGERAIYHPGYYGAFVLDPDGNNVELVDHGRR